MSRERITVFFVRYQKERKAIKLKWIMETLLEYPFNGERW
jgi:hypothetical protein